MKQIQLTQGKVAFVDDDDFERLNKYKWHMRHSYATRYIPVSLGGPKEECMHHAILSPPTGMVVDHIDRNPLNNQRSNLRLCVSQQNSRNKKKQSNGKTSKYKGVCVQYSKRNNIKYYRAKLTIHRSQPELVKIFPFNAEGEIAAARQYNTWAEEHFGEFANLNTV